MNTKIKSVFAAASVLALAVTANAQLQIINLYSTFTPAGIVTTANNGAANASVQAQIGNVTIKTFPYASNTNPPTLGAPPLTLIDAFGVSQGSVRIDAWSLDRLNGSGGTVGAFDFTLGIDLTGGGAVDWSLDFHTDITHSGGFNSNDSYTITLLNPAVLEGNIFFGGNFYSYIITPAGLTGTLANSGTTTPLASIDLRLDRVVVPEPSTYALFGVVALMSLVAVRRIRSSKKVA